MTVLAPEATTRDGSAEPRRPFNTQPPGRRHGLLRAAAAPAHEALDHFTIAAGFFDGPQTFADYLDRMAVFHARYAALAQPIDSQNWRVLWKIDQHPVWIDQERAALGRLHTPHAPGTTLPALSSRAGLLGSIYVLAGSALGARMLHQMTAKRNIPRPGGSTYLAAVGQSLRWSEFLAFLERADIGDGDGELIEGAIATFQEVHRCLEAKP